jgi:hypothetical protein
VLRSACLLRYKVFAFILVAHAAASGQIKRIVIDTTRVCAGCRLTFDSVVTLGLSDRRQQRIQDVVAQADGRFVALTLGLRVPVFSTTGALIDSIGAGGSAPRSTPVAQAVGPRGELFLFSGDQRVVVFDSSGRFRRSLTLASSARGPVILSDGKIAVLTPLLMPAGSKGSVAELPLIRLHDTTGAELRAFGSALADADAALFAGRNGTLWTARSPNELKEWSQTGQLLRVIERPMPGFGGRQFLGDSASGFVQPQLIAARQDEAGLLWVAYINSMRKPGCAKPAAQCWDSVVDVLNPDSGELIATGRLPVLASALLGYGYASALVDASTDRRVAVIYRGLLKRPSR